MAKTPKSEPSQQGPEPQDTSEPNEPKTPVEQDRASEPAPA